MRAQISLEFLYTNAIALIITLFFIGVFVSYYSSSISLPERCVTTYFLNCENIFINSSNIIVSLRNNFDYKINLDKIVIAGTNFSVNKEIAVGANLTTSLALNLSKNTNINLPIELHYKPEGSNNIYILYGRISGKVKE